MKVQSQRQVRPIYVGSKRAKICERTTTLYSSCAFSFCSLPLVKTELVLCSSSILIVSLSIFGFETMRGSTSGCVNQRQAGTSTNANVSTSKSVSYDVIRKTRESPTQVVTLPGQSKSAKNRKCTTLYSLCALLFCMFLFVLCHW